MQLCRWITLSSGVVIEAADFRRPTDGSSSNHRRRMLLSQDTVDVFQTQSDKGKYASGSIYDGSAFTNVNVGHDRASKEKEHEDHQYLVPSGQLKVRGNDLLWSIPFLGCILSYLSFGQVSKLFLKVAQWASSNTWIPQTRSDIDLQTNIVTQVVNGPGESIHILSRGKPSHSRHSITVITSISVLFATLVSLTISKLHSRQVEVHRSLVLEVHYLRELMTLLNSKAVSNTLHSSRVLEARKIVADHVDMLYSTRYATRTERQMTHEYIESTFPDLIAWAIDYDARSMTSTHWDEFVRNVNANIRRLANNLMEQRSNRWMALHTAPFPMVHYCTLAVLAVSIMMSFLVATAQTERIFLEGSPVKVLWSLLTTSFIALGLVCFDLAQPFGGAYHIP